MSQKLYKELNSGIYIITNKVDGKLLVGYASNFTKRKNYHFTFLEENRHKNSYLQNAFNKHGKENFVFEILEEYPNEGFILPSMENYWCNLLDTHNREHGYNLRPTNPYDKVSPTKETRLKMSLANKDKKWTETQREKYIKIRTGKTHIFTKESLERLRAGSTKSIKQLSLTGELVKEWDSITDIVKDLGFGKKYISLCCREKQTNYKGYTWKYAKNENKNN